MRPLPMRQLIATLPMLLAACGAADSDPGPGGVSHSEAQELNEAAEMLDINAVALDEDAATENDR